MNRQATNDIRWIIGRRWIVGQRSRTLPLLAAISLITAGCASTSPKVEEARTSVEQLRADPAVGTNAPVALQRTEESLARLNDAADDGASQAELDHLAYLVERRADATKLRATTVGHWKAVEGLGERREAVLLQAERLEADVARQEAASAIRDAQAARQEAASLQEELDSLEARQTDRGLVVTLGDVLFDVNGASLKPGGTAEVERVARTLAERPDLQVSIEGHTDSTGSETYNLRLSEERAASVRQTLIDAGIPGDRISARGYGESYPVATNDTQSGRQENRRVELILQES
ncbi:MAG: OmpA family protein [Rhodospirillaceae bacterium]|nr:OmpA family protein [Rhodospirillaceae bacterium]